MRKAPVVGIAMLLLATGVHAQILLPPAEYDYPYIDGPIVVTRLQTRSEVDAVCQKKALACARRTWSNVCEIYVLGNEIALGQYGATIALLLRHEIGHCNGWGGDHAGGRTLSHSGIQKLNEMPPARVWPLVDTRHPRPPDQNQAGNLARGLVELGERRLQEIEEQK